MFVITPFIPDVSLHLSVYVGALVGDPHEGRHESFFAHPPSAVLALLLMPRIVPPPIFLIERGIKLRVPDMVALTIVYMT